MECIALFTMEKNGTALTKKKRKGKMENFLIDSY